MVAEFESDLIRLRTREGMKVAKAKGRLCGKQPKLNGNSRGGLAGEPLDEEAGAPPITHDRAYGNLDRHGVHFLTADIAGKCGGVYKPEGASGPH